MRRLLSFFTDQRIDARLHAGEIFFTNSAVSPAALPLSGVGSAQIHRPQSVFPQWEHGDYITEEQDVRNLQWPPIDHHATGLRFTHSLNSDQFPWLWKFLPHTAMYLGVKEMQQVQQSKFTPAIQTDFYIRCQRLLVVACGKMSKHFDVDYSFWINIACLSPALTIDARAQAKYPCLLPLLRVWPHSVSVFSKKSHQNETTKLTYHRHTSGWCTHQSVWRWMVDVPILSQQKTKSRHRHRKNNYISSVHSTFCTQKVHSKHTLVWYLCMALVFVFLTKCLTSYTSTQLHQELLFSPL